jgi:hypothetical protein
MIAMRFSRRLDTIVVNWTWFSTLKCRFHNSPYIPFRYFLTWLIRHTKCLSWSWRGWKIHC